MDINSLPPVPQSHIQAMEREAQKKMAADGIHPEQPQEIQNQQDQELDNVSEENLSEVTQETYEQISKSVKKTPTESFGELKAKADRYARESENRARDNERLARERDEYAHRMREYEKLFSQQQQQVHQPQQEELDFNINPDDLVEGKHFVKMNQKIKNLEEKLYKSQQQSMISNAESLIRAKYHDFDKVVSEENLKMLSYVNPQIARTINSSSDLYDKAVSAYEIIKQMGIYKEDNFDMEKKRAQENSKKPRLAPAANTNQQESALAQAGVFAGELSDDMKKQYYKEMIQARNRM